MIALAALCLAAALGLALGLLMVAQAMGWRRRRIAALTRPWLLMIWILLAIGLSAALANGVAALGPRDFALSGAWLGLSLLLHLLGRRRPDLIHPLQCWGGRIAHGGVAIAVGGMVLSLALTATALHPMDAGDRVGFNGWTIQLHEVWPAAGPDWAGVAAELRASSGGGVVLLEPEVRNYANGAQRGERATSASPGGLLTATIGLRDRDGRWPVRLGWTPLLILIPIGGAIAALGGALAMVGPPISRWRRMRRARLATAWWA